MEGTPRPIGPLVEQSPAIAPSGETLVGAHVRLEVVDPERHGPALWEVNSGHDHLWDYLYEPVPQTCAAFIETLQVSCSKPDWHGYAICLPDGAAVGYAFYLNIVPAMGTIEVGNINFSPTLQRSVAATEAMFLMMQNAFSLEYRRYEWKCNALNAPSRRAAQRLGFSWEGIFRQHLIVKGRNRDTAWFAMTDRDWPQMHTAFEVWLSDANFAPDGTQLRTLTELTAPHLVAKDPARKG